MKIPVKSAQRHIAFYDVHVPHNINFDSTLKFMKKYKPTHVIIGGDFVNLEWASHWNEGVFKQVGWSAIRENLGMECSAARDLLRRIRKAAPKAHMIFIPGNHEHWLYYASLYFPQIGIPFPGGVTKLDFKSDIAKAGDAALAEILRSVLHSDKIGFDVLDYNEHLDIGKITYLHGHQLKGYKNTMKLYPNKNIVFGHFHSEFRDTGNNSGDEGKAVQHQLVPCMTHLGPGYLKDKSTRWLNGFWVAEVLPNGLFDGRVVKILGGKTLIQKP